MEDIITNSKSDPVVMKEYGLNDVKLFSLDNNNH
jgi:hypothetical protein